MGKIICFMVAIFICLPLIMVGQVSASSINSKAGITFSNSYTPSESLDSTDPSISEESINNSSIEKKNLPKTGGEQTVILPYIGFLLMIVSLFLFIRIIQRNKILY